MKLAVLFLLSVVPLVAGAQSPVQEESPTQVTLAREYWSDHSTGLMWTAKDNGEDITWGKAVKFCHNLSVAGYSKWRLPSIDELQNIYDGSGFTGPDSRGSMPAFAGRAKGRLLLTGVREWSASRVVDDRGHKTGIAWQYDFSRGERWRYDPLGYKSQLRALCVRRP